MCFIDVSSGKTTSCALRLKVRSCMQVFAHAILTGARAFSLADQYRSRSNGYAATTLLIGGMMNDSIFYVEARWGGGEKSPSLQRLIELIAELKVRDEEHPDTWMIHENSGWALRLDEDRFAYLEDPECGTGKHMADVSSETALKLWTAFAAGGPDAVADFGWKPGQRPVNELELAERAERARDAQLRSDREFYDQLGPQMSDANCRVEGCRQGRIQYSVLCKAHHFEQVRGRPCPFSE